MHTTMEWILAMAKTDSHKQQLGKWGEQTAAVFLTGRGYSILGKNLRTPYGEIDLLAEKDNILIFVEVKTRSNRSFGEPEEAITDDKKAHMVAAAEAYLQGHPECNQDWRIDVISLVRSSPGKVEIRHFENAVS